MYSDKSLFIYRLSPKSFSISEKKGSIQAEYTKKELLKIATTLIKKCARYAVKNTGEIEARRYLGCERSSQNLKARASLEALKKEASRRA